MFNQFINHLKFNYSNNLPGFDAQKIMSPINRNPINNYLEKKSSAREASTLMLFYPNKENVPHFVLTQRMDYAGVHGGQISLPGGKKEKYDQNFEQAALRETFEEIGVETNSIQMLGPLTELYIPPSNFFVYPFIGYTNTTPLFIPQKNEVAKIIEVPFNFLTDVSLRKEKLITLSGTNMKINAPYFDFFGHEVWGATAMMLSETAELLKDFQLK